MHFSRVKTYSWLNQSTKKSYNDKQNATIMTSQAIQPQSHELEHQMFDMAAELFQVMSAPMRLRIINALCDGEKHVSYLLSKIDTTQPNMSQHLTTLYHAGIVGKRRDGVHI